MIGLIKSMFNRKETKTPEKYMGLSDFFLHAPIKEKKEVIREAALKSNKDQLETFRKAEVKLMN